jgi:hypothetical protein
MIGERLTFIQLVGMMVMITGVILVQRVIKPGVPASILNE